MESNTNMIQVLVNYWEIRPSQMQQRLSDLLRKGVSQVTSFVPWQAVESDISHLLSKFLLAAFEQNVRVSLVITPEVGVNYPGGGLPKDLVSNPANLAKNSAGNPYTVVLPPAVFALPTLFSQEVIERYQQFLIRLDGLLNDLEKAEPGILNNIQLVMTGSYWKYYRCRGARALQERSLVAGAAFRSHVEQRYSTREFASAESGGATRWKSQAMEDVNWNGFYESSVEQFRTRSEQFLKRRRSKSVVHQVELYTPEADSAHSYAYLWQLVSGQSVDVAALDAWVDELVLRKTASAGSTLPGFVHWTGLGIFKTLTDSEKQYLLLKSIFLLGMRDGGVLVDENEWFSLPASFRARAESIARTLSRGELKKQSDMYYYSSSCWSNLGVLGSRFKEQCRSGFTSVSSLEILQRDRSARLCVVDPSVVLTHEMICRLIDWAQEGRVVVIPRSPMYTDSARRALDQALSRGKRMELNLGVPYVLQSFPELGHGKLIVYSQPEAVSSREETLEAWSKFAESMVAIADIQPMCQASDPRIQCVTAKTDFSTGLLIMNPTSEAIEVDLEFQSPVAVSDLSWFFVRERKNQPAEMVEPAKKFTVGIPPRGVIPLNLISKELEKYGTQAGLESI